MSLGDIYNSGGTGAYNNPYIVNEVDTTINSSGVAPQNSPPLPAPNYGMGSVKIEEMPVEDISIIR